MCDTSSDRTANVCAACVFGHANSDGEAHASALKLFGALGKVSWVGNTSELKAAVRLRAITWGGAIIMSHVPG